MSVEALPPLSPFALSSMAGTERKPPVRVKRLPLNETGRDFLVGDLHGSFDLLERALAAVAFDPGNDRLIVAGDLIDRGPDSWRVTEWLARPFVHAVRGNHCDAFAQVYATGDRCDALLRFCARHMDSHWALDVDDDVCRSVAQALGDLPYVIEVETRRGLVGVVHADVPKGWSWDLFRTAILTGDPNALGHALDGRRRVDARDCAGVPGIGRVFVGHCIQMGGPKIYGNVVAMDCGAFLTSRPYWAARTEREGRSLTGAFHTAIAEGYGLAIANVAAEDSELLSPIQANGLFVAPCEGGLVFSGAVLPAAAPVYAPA